MECEKSSAKRAKVNKPRVNSLMFLAQTCFIGGQAAPEVSSLDTLAFVAVRELMGSDVQQTDVQQPDAQQVANATTSQALSSDASTQTPVNSEEVGKKRSRNDSIITPLCPYPDHAVCRNSSNERQRHTCFKCFRGDWQLLKTNKCITPWQLSRIVGSMTRQYVCNLCVLEKAGEQDLEHNIPRPSHCRRHLVFWQQKTCKHQQLWTKCTECLHDPRAGTSCCNFCGVMGVKNCGCPRGPIALRDAVVKTASDLPDEQVGLMAKLAADVLDYANQLQATQKIEDTAQREAKINEIKTTFQFRDTSKLNNLFKAV
jgi:hypothetical protein